jgi:predicted phage terminase large subunit-like protein
MGRDPRRYTMSASYNLILARDFGRAVMGILRSKQYKLVFPELSLTSRSVEAIKTSANGSYYSVGLGATTSGRPATCLIVDDPVKSRKDAASKLSREDVWSYYTASLEARLQPTWDGMAPMRIVIMTRWHPDDLCGRIMKTDAWRRGEWCHLEYPAIINESSREVLWPERFHYKMLADKRALDPGEFECLYQQRPYISGGEIFKGDWWQYYTPDLLPKEFATVIIVADTAVKGDEEHDFTVFQAWALDNDGNIFVLDQLRRRIDYVEQRKVLPVFASRFKGQGLRGVYIEDVQSGSALVQDLRRDTGLPIIPWRSFKDKAMRANIVTPLIQAGRVFLPNNAVWLDEFLSEHEQFPSSKFDDQVDATTMALEVLSRITTPESGMSQPLGESLLAQYNRSREIVVGNAKTKTRSLMSQFPRNFKWKGWGG